jgi:hypothetical protein
VRFGSQVALGALDTQKRANVHLLRILSLGQRPALARASNRRDGVGRSRYQGTLGQIKFADANVHGRSMEFESAVRLILTDIWAMLGVTDAEQSIEPLLADSWAGALLARMKEHHAAILEATRRHMEDQDPARVEARRAEKRLIRQERHAARLAKNKDKTNSDRSTVRSVVF